MRNKLSAKQKVTRESDDKKKRTYKHILLYCDQHIPNIAFYEKYEPEINRKWNGME